jgi:hypothetical protein
MWSCAGRSISQTRRSPERLNKTPTAIGNVAGPMRTPARTRSLTISRIPVHRRDIHFTKRQTDMPSEHTMRFFTPELYLRFNSLRDDEAIAADAEWENAICRYKSYLESIRGKMPSQVAQLAEFCLHDAEILLRTERQEPIDSPCAFPPFWPWVPWVGVFRFAVLLDEEVLSLLYFLYDHITEKPATPGWRFSKSHEHWLYDEIEFVPGNDGHFIHSVLLSSGIALSIPFSTVLITHIPIARAEKIDRPKRTA